MLSGIAQKIAAMPLVAAGIAMLAGEVVKPGMRIRDIVDRIGGRY